MNETKPTAGAMRAAYKFARPACPLPEVQALARTIDRETGLPEMIAALRDVDSCLRGDVNYEHACMTTVTSETATTPAKLVRALLAKHHAP